MKGDVSGARGLIAGLVGKAKALSGVNEVFMSRSQSVERAIFLLLTSS
jgi:hypothetical protein